MQTLACSIYLVVMILIIAVGCLEVGSRASDIHSEPTVDSITNYIGIGLLWPLVLTGVSIFLPFYGLYRLGKVLRNFR